MANVSFKRGLQASLPKTNIVDGAFYLTTDTNRLYVGGANNKLELLNQSIKFYTYDEVFGAASTVPKVEGQFYYLSDRNVLCTYKGNDWIQINPDHNDNTIVYTSGLEVEKANSAVGEAKKLTYTIKLNQEKKEKTGDAVAYGEPVTASFEINPEDLNKIASNVSVGLESTDVANGFELKNSGGGADGAKTVQIKGGNNVTITRADDGNVTIAAKDTNTTYSMESPAESTSILLKSDGAGDAPSVTFTGDKKVQVSGAEANKIVISHATSGVTADDYVATDVDKTTNKFSVPQFSVDGTGHVTAASTKEITIPAQHNTTYTIESIKANTDGDLSVSLKADDKGQAVTTTSKQALYYKVTIDDAPEKTICNGNSLGEFYSAKKTKELIKDAKKTMDAMTYKGVINEEEFGLIAGSQKGDTYKASASFTVNGQSAKTGDLIIYKGNDLAADITPAAIDWDIVPSGDDIDSQFSLSGAGNSITLTNDTSGETAGSVSVIGKNGIAATVNDNTLTVGHTNTEITAGTVGNNTNLEPNALGSIIVPSITYDAWGHITRAEDKTITLPADKDTTYEITTAKDDNNNAVIILSEIGNALGNAPTATFTPGVGITLKGAKEGITITHADPGIAIDTFGENAAAQVDYGNTFKVPQISRDAKGHITQIKDVEIQMPSAQDIPRVIFSGETSVVKNRATFTSKLKVGETGDVQSFAPSIGSDSLKVSVTKGNEITMELEWGSW